MFSLLKKIEERPLVVVGLLLLLTLLVLEGDIFFRQGKLSPEVVLCNHVFSFMLLVLGVLLQQKKINPVNGLLIFSVFYSYFSFLPCFFISETSTIDHCLSVRKHGVILLCLLLLGIYNQVLLMLFTGSTYLLLLYANMCLLHLQGWGNFFVVQLPTVFIVSVVSALLFINFFRLDQYKKMTEFQKIFFAKVHQRFNSLVELERQKENTQCMEDFKHKKMKVNNLTLLVDKIAEEQSHSQRKALANQFKKESREVDSFFDDHLEQLSLQSDEAIFNTKFRMQCPDLSDIELKACWYEYLGYSVQKIAQKQQVSSDAIKSRLLKARQKLKAAKCPELLHLIAQRKKKVPGTFRDENPNPNQA